MQLGMDGEIKYFANIFITVIVTIITIKQQQLQHYQHYHHHTNNNNDNNKVPSYLSNSILSKS